MARGANVGAHRPGSTASRSERRWLTEPARPDWLRDRPNAHYYALATVCVGAFMGQLDASIVTVAFPTLQHVFGVSVAAVTWVGLTYLIVLVAGVTAVGRLADMVGHKLLYTYGFVVFAAGSALCALAPSLIALDAFRAVQALGAALLQANSLAIIYLAMPSDRLGRGLGVQGAAQALGLALGPTVGGLLLAAGGWRLIFLVNVPAGLLGVLAARMLLPRSRELGAREPFDWAGLVLFGPAVVAGLVVLSFGGSWGWGSPTIVVLAVVAVALAAGFVTRERRARSPMLDLSLFRRAQFSIGTASGLLSYVVLFGVLFAVPFFLERGRGLDAARAGLLLTVVPLTLGATAPIAGHHAERIGPRRLTVVGMLVVAAALLVAGLTQPALPLLAATLAVVGVGMGMFTPANNTAVLGTVPRRQAGVASGVLNMTRGLGTAVGLALTATLTGGAVAGADPSVATHGFTVAAVVLAGVAVLAAAVAAARPGRTGEGGLDGAPHHGTGILGRCRPSTSTRMSVSGTSRRPPTPSSSTSSPAPASPAALMPATTRSCAIPSPRPPGGASPSAPTPPTRTGPDSAGGPSASRPVGSPRSSTPRSAP